MVQAPLRAENQLGEKCCSSRGKSREFGLLGFRTGLQCGFSSNNLFRFSSGSKAQFCYCLGWGGGKISQEAVYLEETVHLQRRETHSYKKRTLKYANLFDVSVSHAKKSKVQT